MQLIQHFRRAAAREPDRMAFVQPDGAALTYREAAETVEGIASALLASGLRGDAKIAIYSPNDARAFLAILGTMRAGLTWVPLNARNTVADNAAFVVATDVQFLFFHSQFADAVEAIRAEAPLVTTCICLDQASGAWPSLASFSQRSAARVAELDDDNARPCNILATGGTTGRSKGAVWTNLTWEALIANFWTSAPRVSHPVHLCVAPMTHGAGVLALMLMPAAPTNVLLTKADPLTVLEAIARYRVTHLFLPPTVLYNLLSSPELGRHDTSTLSFFLISAAPVSADKLREAVRAFGPVICQAFGQAEAPFFLTFLSAKDLQRAISNEGDARLLRSCGQATMFSQVEIMGEHGSILGPDEVGEIVARGNLVIPGYYNDEEGTRAISEYGWHHTGDIGFKDTEDYVYIVDRKRDMIITGGFNVYSTEVEKVLLTHDAILDCAVIGVPDEKWGEAVTAVVELKPGASVSPEELVSHCRAALGGVKAPKAVEIWDTLPRSAVGKVLKRAIRERFWTGRDRSI